MKTSIQTRVPGRQRLGWLVCLGLVLPAFSAQGTEVASATLTMESQAIDLDSGTVHSYEPGAVMPPPGVDLIIVYHADRSLHAVAMPAAEGVTMAFLDGWTFDAVSATKLEGLTLSANPPDVTLTGFDTVVVRTDTGAIFKVGNALEQNMSVAVDYLQLQ